MGPHGVRPLALLALLALPGLATATQVGPDAYGNVSGGIPLDWVPLDGSTGITGTPVAVGANDSDDVALPFSFPWYGAFTQVVAVSPNGALRFAAGESVADLNDSIPSPAGAVPDVAALWDAFDPTVGGTVRTYDDVPGGRFIISWDEVRHGIAPGTASFQVHLYTDGSLEVHWSDTEVGDALYDDGASATVGIQDVLGGSQGAGNALLLSYNTASVASGLAQYFGPCGVDIDGDGFVSSACSTGAGADCDDFDPSVNPSGAEVCDDGVDQDCDGGDLLGDLDADGYVSVACGGADCDPDDPAVNPGVDADSDGVDACLDCDDGAAGTYPGAAEACDSVDTDCDGLDDGQDLDVGADSDGDGWVDACGDCDGSSGAVYPDAPEVCGDNVDQDCDGVDLPADGDGDSFASLGCGGSDCDDADASVYPGAPEFVCDGTDQACDGYGNEEDADGDGYALCDADCDDGDPLTWPGAPELCVDGVDNDCDGDIDEGIDDDYVLSDDGGLTFEVCTFSFPFCGDTFDTFTLHANGRLTFGDAGGAGVTDGSGADFTSAGSLSDLHGEAPQLAFLWSDLNPTVLGTVHVEEDVSTATVQVTFDGVTQDPGWPGAVLGGNTVTVTFGATGVTTYSYGALVAELALVGWSCGNSAPLEVDLSDPGLPDGVARIGQGAESAIYEVFEGTAVGGNDLDLANDTVAFCLTDGTDGDADGWSDQCGDCDDGDPTVYPGATELCDGEDHDCNGVVDDADLDGDGYLSTVCGGADCDDDDPETNPLAFEACDGLDNDCDGLPETGGEDADDDGWLVCGGDCDDGDAEVNPDGIEVCNSVDDNCDTVIDEGWIHDQDADGALRPECGGDDCDDLDGDVSPLEGESCDFKDNDCDGVVDNIDLDGDGYLDSACGGDDCNDLRAQVHPGADEVCDGNDNDCNGVDNDVDLDGDGEIEANCGGTDCDDGDPTVNTSAAEVCDDGADNDCNGGTDQGGGDTVADPACTGCTCAMSAEPTRLDPLWALLLLGALALPRRTRSALAR
jgi:hypothetical protein